MKRFILWKLAILLGALTMFGCPSGGDAPAEGDDNGEASGDEAAAEEGGDEAAGEEGGEEAAEEEAAEPATQPAGEEAAAPAGDFTATNDSLHGTWDADMQATLAGMPEEERALAAMLLGSAQMNLTFGADGTMNMSMTMMGEEQSQAGTFSVTSTEGNVVNLTTTTEEEGEQKTETMTATFTDANTLELRSADDPQAFVFKRRV